MPATNAECHDVTLLFRIPPTVSLLTLNPRRNHPAPSPPQVRKDSSSSPSFGRYDHLNTSVPFLSCTQKSSWPQTIPFERPPSWTLPTMHVYVIFPPDFIVPPPPCVHPPPPSPPKQCCFSCHPDTKQVFDYLLGSGLRAHGGAGFLCPLVPPLQARKCGENRWFCRG
mgnify:CR=1 FL=1